MIPNEYEIIVTPPAAQAAQPTCHRHPWQTHRELEALYREWSEEPELVGAGVGNGQTPPLLRRGLDYNTLVGAEGFEPPTSSLYDISRSALCYIVDSA